VPLQFTHLHAARMLSSMRKQAALADVLHSRGDDLRYGLRVKLVLYPENYYCVQTMLACKYREVDND
jgi:hypothetical protein